MFDEKLVHPIVSARTSPGGDGRGTCRINPDSSLYSCITACFHSCVTLCVSSSFFIVKLYFLLLDGWRGARMLNAGRFPLIVTHLLLLGDTGRVNFLSSPPTPPSLSK